MGMRSAEALAHFAAFLCGLEGSVAKAHPRSECQGTSAQAHESWDSAFIVYMTTS